MSVFTGGLLQVLTLFNLFITFGDTFLPSPLIYDFLYYEIIRQSDVFDNLHSTREFLIRNFLALFYYYNNSVASIIDAVDVILIQYFSE